MLQSLNTAVSGLTQLQDRMDVIGNNIANVNTVGYKGARTEFADAFSQTLQYSSASTAVNTGTTAIQVGSGVTTTSIKNLFTQGALTRTGVPTDLAVAGEGYFLVRDTFSNVQYATRAGDFRVDSNGYLVTNQGMRVQGYSDSGLTTFGDVQIDTTGAPAGTSIVSHSFGADGKLNLQLSDGSQFTRGQILMQKYADQNALVKEGYNLFSGLGAAGGLATPTAPGGSGLGRLEAGALENSNVDLANEFTSLITTQRAYQANARMITTSDEVLQELVNLVR